MAASATEWIPRIETLDKSIPSAHSNGNDADEQR